MRLAPLAPDVPAAPAALSADIDRLGALRLQLEALEAEEKALAGSIKLRLIERGRATCHSDEYVAGISVHERVSLDSKAAKALLIEHGLEPPCVSQVIESLTIVRIA